MEETKGESFDWNEFLAKATQPDYQPDDDEIVSITSKSQSWVTCACGNACNIIPRNGPNDTDEDHSPKDYQLRELGIKFYRDIKRQDWETAKNTLDAIEQRSTLLIDQMVKEASDVLTKFGYKILKPKSK